MKPLLFLLIALVGSSAHAKTKDPSIKDYLKGKGVTYMVRFWERQVPPAAQRDVTVACYEGLLENEIRQNPKTEYNYIGNLDFRVGDILATIQVQSESWDEGRKQGSVLMHSFYYPPQSKTPDVGFAMGSAGIYNLSSEFKEMISSNERVFSNAMAYQDYEEPNPVKEIGVSLNINHNSKYGCEFYKKKGSK